MTFLYPVAVVVASLIFKSVNLTRNYSALTDKPEADGVLNILLTSIQSVLIRFSSFQRYLNLIKARGKEKSRNNDLRWESNSGHKN